MSRTKHVLVVGLAGIPPQAAGEVRAAAGTEATLAKMIEDGVKRAAELGFEMDIQQTHPEDFEATVIDVRAKLRSTPYDGYIVGFGIRGIKEFTETFEKLVNAGRERAPHTRMGFNTRPDDLVETMQRMFKDA